MIAQLQRIKKSEFVRHVGTLATGSLLAQLISLAAAPIVTRLYEPADYAVLALFTAIVSAISPAACGGYDVAVVIAKDEKDSGGLFVLSIWVAGAISLVMLLVFMLTQEPLKEFLGAYALGHWWLVVPFVLFLTAVVTALKYYANRYKGYVLISRVIVTQSVLSVTLTISLGVIGFRSNGLLIALLLSAVFGTVLLLYSYRKELGRLPWRPTRINSNLAMRYKKFPLYNAAPSFLDSLTLALPVLFLTKYFPEVIVGYYALLSRVANAPLGFIAQAVSQVHIRKVAEQVNNNQDPTKYVLHLSLILAAIVTPPTLLVMLYAPSLFAWLFGSQWRMAGELLVILMPALAVRFVVSTVSGVFSSTGNNHLAAFWKIVAFILTFFLFWTFADHLMVQHLFIAMAITDLALYSFYYFLIFYAIRHRREFN